MCRSFLSSFFPSFFLDREVLLGRTLQYSHGYVRTIDAVVSGLM